MERFPLGVGGWSVKLNISKCSERVRGGRSISFFESEKNYAKFYGRLDTETLGGAGFASRRVKRDQSWNFKDESGLEIKIKKGDSKR